MNTATRLPIYTDPTDYDTRPASPWTNPNVKAALDALNAKRATGWRPAERTDWATPQNVTCLGNPIDKDATAKAIAEHGFTDDEIAQINADVKAWTAAHQEADPEARFCSSEHAWTDDDQTP